MRQLDLCFHRHKKLKACIGRNSLYLNQINELPDDIIIRILSLLKMKEAGRTSLLAKRWRYLWAYVPALNFDASEIIEELRLDEDLLEQEEPKYFGWVDQVVSSYKAFTIDEFRVHFDLEESRKDNIDNWLKFAIDRKVKRLDLNIAPCKLTCKLLSYSFPTLYFWDSLTSLRLAYVDVTGEMLEKLLDNCQTLECMSVEQSKSLVSLKVSGPSLSLKSLSIMYCFEMKSLELSAPNLTHCAYFGRKLQSSPFKSTPKLTELFIGGYYATRLLYYGFSHLLCCISQIEVLTLYAMLNLKRVAQEFPICTRLKTLHVRVDPMSDEELFDLRFLLKACPLLHKFVLQLSLPGNEIKRTKRTMKVEACPFHHLKIVEIVEFVGWEVDTAFAMYLIENVVSLEKIVITPIQHTSPEITLAKSRRAMEQAEQLHSHVKPWTELEIRTSYLNVLG